MNLPPRRRLLEKNRFGSKPDGDPHPLGIVVTWLKGAAAILVPTYAAFLFGQITENKKRIDENEHLLFQQRMSLWVDVASDFEAFLQNREGLRKVAQLERMMQRGPPGSLAALKSTYMVDRNSAHRKLVADLRKAELFFTEKVHAEIVRFRQFDKGDSEKNLDTMATLEEFSSYEDSILSLMKTEVRDDIERVKDISHVQFLPFFRLSR